MSKTDFLYAQAPNRKGNISKHLPKHEDLSGGTSMTKFAAGHVGAPKASGNPLSGGQKVQVSYPKCEYGDNSGYRGSENKFS